MDVGNDNKRYYPSQMEQTILSQSVQNYFSKPERSVERNKIAAEVSAKLSQINPHWTHRAVRLWFNNNKHTFNEGNMQTQNPQPQTPMQIQHSVHFAESTYNKNPPPQIMQGQQLIPGPPGFPNPQSHIPAMQYPMQPPLAMNQPIQMSQINPYQPQMNMQPTMQMPKPHQPVKIQNPPISLGKQIKQKVQSTPPTQNSIIPTQKVESKPPLQTNWSKIQPDLQKTLSSLLSESLKVDDSKMPPIIQQYDQLLQDMRSMGQSIDISYTSIQHNSLTYPSDNSDFSFSSNTNLSSQEQPAFQTRLSIDTKINSQFHASFVDDTCAAFVHCARFSPNRALSYEFVDSPQFGNDWRTEKIGLNSRIERIVVDSDHKCAWMLGTSKLLRLHLDPNQRLQSADLIPQNATMYPANLLIYKGVVITGYAESNVLYAVDNRMEVKQIETPFSNNGFSCIASMDDAILCGLTNSAAIRLIDDNGQEIRSFIGHSDIPIHLAKMSENTFLSAADDRRLKFWDVRQHPPVGDINTKRKSIVSISGCQQYAVYAIHSNQICAVDVRQSHLKSVVCVSTEEYQTSNMHYNPASDTLSLFGIADKDGNNDSLLFLDDEGSSRKYIFRRYTNFIHL